MFKLSLLFVLSIALVIKAVSIYPPSQESHHEEYESPKMKMNEVTMDESKSYQPDMTKSYDHMMDGDNKYESSYKEITTQKYAEPTTYPTTYNKESSQSEYRIDQVDYQPQQKQHLSTSYNNVPYDDSDISGYKGSDMGEMNVYQNQPSAPSGTYDSDPYEQSSSDNDMKMNDYEKPSSSYQPNVVIMECKEHLTVVDGDCSKYKTCANGILNIMSCPDNLVFDSHLKICNRPESVSGPCGAKQSQQYQNY
ncbi:unnamed protein product [Brachionus calyciflorus]|uniref:Chitin-binding type-2 domain-containing protein n=1 Tax=Brachionus calyciflorus TaxID=104777 RepID=A0A813PC38_9BILA|nr:unnamed protein product [Brachionus calyciflorus]